MTSINLPQNKNTHSQNFFINPNSLNYTTQLSLQSSEWTICSASACVYLLAKFVPLSGGALRVSELARALFDYRSLHLHVKQLLILETADKREERKRETKGGAHKHSKSYISD